MEHRETNKPVQEPKEPRMNLAGWIVIGGTILMAVLIMTFGVDWTGFSITELPGLFRDILKDFFKGLVYGIAALVYCTVQN